MRRYILGTGRLAAVALGSKTAWLPPLAEVSRAQGRLGFPLRQEAVLRTLTADVVKTSESKARSWTPNRFGPLSHGASAWTSPG
jgi:hypothetical protein